MSWGFLEGLARGEKNMISGDGTLAGVIVRVLLRGRFLSGLADCGRAASSLSKSGDCFPEAIGTF